MPGVSAPQVPPVPAERWVDLEGGSNVRDLGGLPLRDGGTTASGVFYRSDTPQEWTAADQAQWRARGLALVVDLRAPAEVEAEGRAPVDCAWVNTPLIPNGAIVPGEEAPEHEDEAIVVDADLDERVAHYLGYLTGYGGPHLVRAVLALAAAEGPALFHCAAGKDRTGVLAAVLQELADVEREAVVADYALSSERIAAIDARLRRLPTYAAGLEGIPRDLLMTRPETMRDLLAAVDEHLGGVRSWLLGRGVPAGELDLLAARLRGETA